MYNTEVLTACTFQCINFNTSVNYENSTVIETAALQWKIESLPDTNPTL